MKKKLIADLVVYDEMSMIYYNNGQYKKPIEYTTSSLVQKALGGTEFQIILLMHECAKKGLKVVCFNNNIVESEDCGVRFIPRKYLQDYEVVCKNLITSRYSSVPNIVFDRCFLWMHDVALPRIINFSPLFEHSDKFSIVCPSEWSRSLFPKSWACHVVNNMLPDWVYEYKSNKKRKDYIYASSAMKGLEPTLLFWDRLNKDGVFKNKKLKILSPGYDTPDGSSFNRDTLKFLGSIPFHEVIEEIASSQALFYVNDMPETFCIVAALCEALGTKMHILTLRGDGALKEVLNTDCVYNDYMEFIKNAKKMKKLSAPRDYRISTIFKQWEKLLC